MMELLTVIVLGAALFVAMLAVCLAPFALFLLAELWDALWGDL